MAKIKKETSITPMIHGYTATSKSPSKKDKKKFGGPYKQLKHSLKEYLENMKTLLEAEADKAEDKTDSNKRDWQFSFQVPGYGTQETTVAGMSDKKEAFRLAKKKVSDSIAAHDKAFKDFNKIKLTSMKPVPFSHQRYAPAIDAKTNPDAPELKKTQDRKTPNQRAKDKADEFLKSKLGTASEKPSDIKLSAASDVTKKEVADTLELLSRKSSNSHIESIKNVLEKYVDGNLPKDAQEKVNGFVNSLKEKNGKITPEVIVALANKRKEESTSKAQQKLKTFKVKSKAAGGNVDPYEEPAQDDFRDFPGVSSTDEFEKKIPGGKNDLESIYKRIAGNLVKPGKDGGFAEDIVDSVREQYPNVELDNLLRKVDKEGTQDSSFFDKIDIALRKMRATEGGDASLERNALASLRQKLNPEVHAKTVSGPGKGLSNFEKGLYPILSRDLPKMQAAKTLEKYISGVESGHSFFPETPEEANDISKYKFADGKPATEQDVSLIRKFITFFDKIEESPAIDGDMDKAAMMFLKNQHQTPQKPSLAAKEPPVGDDLPGSELKSADANVRRTAAANRFNTLSTATPKRLGGKPLKRLQEPASDTEEFIKRMKDKNKESIPGPSESFDISKMKLSEMLFLNPNSDEVLEAPEEVDADFLPKSMKCKDKKKK